MSDNEYSPELQFATTDEIVQELVKRKRVVIVAYEDEDGVWVKDSQNCFLTILGLAKTTMTYYEGIDRKAWEIDKVENDEKDSF